MRETELDKVLNEVEGSLRETAKETERIINDTQEKLTVNLPPKEKPEEKGEETAEQPGEESSEDRQRKRSGRSPYFTQNLDHRAEKNER